MVSPVRLSCTGKRNHVRLNMREACRCLSARLLFGFCECWGPESADCWLGTLPSCADRHHFACLVI